ncbi:MAG: 4-alpha-glucanotransferase [Paludibacteraceae bacterium]|nr:4-alpha-glucanotransferase [Paludibacteraceae bacterium]
MKFHLTIEPNTQLLIKMYRLRMAVVGSQNTLGNWLYKEVNVLATSNGRDYFIEKNDVSFPLEYKYVMVDEQGDIRYWQDGDNYLQNQPVDSRDDLPLFKDSYPRVAGVVLPVFSLRSALDGGVGEFPDLKLLVDVAKKTGLRIIQTLPVNDTTLTGTRADSYPYNPLSIKALNPLYIRIDDIEGLGADLLEKYHKKAKKLNRLKKMDYENVYALKMEFLKAAYDAVKNGLEQSAPYRNFVSENGDWIKSYALYCCLRDKYKTTDLSQWKEMPQYDEEKADALLAEFENAGFYVFVQYYADKQLKEASDYARSNGILLKGDIPIGVSPNSVDVWMQPEQFNTRMSAGAPPDFFSNKGQNWGFPTYNWDVMAKDGFAWWKSRLKKMEKYFDAYRIDHILGFFRIWSVRTDEFWGLMGQFDKAKAYAYSEVLKNGLMLSFEQLTEPYFTREQMQRLFGQDADFMIKTFTVPADGDRLRLGSHCSTQRAIYAVCKKNGVSKENTEKMLTARTWVLFIKDKNNERELHPRIAKERNEAYNALTASQKAVYDQMYDEYFYRRNDSLWHEQAMMKLPELQRASGMIVCGEDLGMIPDCVPDVMRQLKIMTLEIQSMPKQQWAEFDNLDNVPYYAVCTTTTHDMPPLRLWWKEMMANDKAKLERFYKNTLGMQGELPNSIDGGTALAIVKQHLNSPAMMCIIPFQDYISTSIRMTKGVNEADERINMPDNPKNEWCYRMNIALEDLLGDDSFLGSIKGMVEKSGRLI